MGPILNRPPLPVPSQGTALPFCFFLISLPSAGSRCGALASCPAFGLKLHTELSGSSNPWFGKKKLKKGNRISYLRGFSLFGEMKFLVLRRPDSAFPLSPATGTVSSFLSPLAFRSTKARFGSAGLK